jgi:outer membrane protein assembly factor BamA
MGMGVFRYVNIKFSDTLVNGEGRLNAYISMTPNQRRSLQVEMQAVTKSNNYTGPALTASFKNRNLFHGAELFLFNLNTNYETQYSGSQKGLNSYELGANTQLLIPKFIIPFFSLHNLSAEFVPHTKIDLGFRNVNRVQYFSMNAANFSYGYTWKETARKAHELNPVAVNFAKLRNTTKAFDDLLLQNPFLKKSFEEQFTIGGNYSFTYNSLLNSTNQHQYFLNIMLDASGNSIYLAQTLTNGKRSAEDQPFTLFGYNYSQYSKLTTDGRYHFIINKNHSIATHVIWGVGVPYGNSTTLPYIKQFFSGGSNSIRAFLPRTVGPGTYRKPDSLLSRGFLDQAGDIKLEGSLEYRFNIIDPLKGAIFADAGNIWLFRANDELPGGAFNVHTFYRQLAVGTGFGLRLDITYFVLRFDLGMPLRRPYLAEHNGWVINQINFREGSWRAQNLVLNIAIGYPF